jgi:drug/metabolite transporter (DMT)-like permease
MCLWGISWPSGKMLTRYASVINVSVYRFIIVGITLLLLLPLFRVSLRVKKQGIPFILASGALLAVYSYLSIKGLKTGSPGAGGVLVTTLNPIIAYAVGMLLHRKMPTVNEAIGLVLGMVAGCVLLKVWDNSVSLLYKGNLYFLLAAFTWAVMSKFTSGGAKYGTSMAFSLWQYLVTLVCMLPLADFGELGAAVHIQDPLFWINLVFSAAIVTAIATTIYFYATTRIGAEKASSFIFLVPLAAAVSSWVFLGERIMLHTAIGGLLGMAAVYMINRKKTRVEDEAVVNVVE